MSFLSLNRTENDIVIFADSKQKLRTLGLACKESAPDSGLTSDCLMFIFHYVYRFFSNLKSLLSYLSF